MATTSSPTATLYEFPRDTGSKSLEALKTISRLRKKGKALSRSVWSLNCLGGIRHVIGQFA